MAMAEDRINDDERDGTITDAEAQIEATLFKQGQEYAARNQRSQAENKGRAESRAAIKSLGMNPSAYAQAVKLIKDLTPSELKDWRRDFELTLKVMGSKQKELFPMEQLAAEQRAKRAAEKAAGKPRTQAELDAATDSNPKSDPAAGGAQIDIEEAIARQAAEQAEGDAILAGKSEAWRGGYIAQGAGAQRGDSPHIEGSAEARDWLAGYAESSERSFAAAAPDPVMVDGQTYSDGVGKAEQPEPPAPSAPKKQSQSAKAAAKKAAAGI